MKDVWSLHAYTYHGELSVNGVNYQIVPGAVSIVPPWSEMSFRFRAPSYHISAFFTYDTSAHRTTTMPVVAYLGEEFTRVCDGLEKAKAFFPLFPLRAEVKLWDILLSICSEYGIDSFESGPSHTHVQRAIGHIESNIDSNLRVPLIAQEVSISATHLVRLFQKYLNMTIVGYIRWRRAELARHLLIHTDLPIKHIVSAVGLSDIQHLYKTIRKEFDQTPGELRAGIDCGGEKFSVLPKDLRLERLVDISV